MRTMTMALALITVASSALADDLEEAHRQALQGRDSYWNCLAREYSPDHIKTMSTQDFTADIASACASERQNFRVSLIGYLSMQAPDARPSGHRQPGDRARAKGHHHRVRPAQGRVKLRGSRNLNSAMFHATNRRGNKRGEGQLGFLV